jgi:metallo-beta-lactamase class B
MKYLFPLSVIVAVLLSTCSENKNSKQEAILIDSTLYKTETLIIKKLSDRVYQHITFLATQDFGKVDCNGMIVIDSGEAIVFDTPTDSTATVELLNWLAKNQLKVKAIIPTHFHNDCVGGLKEFHSHEIPSYAHALTIDFLKQQPDAVIPQNGFEGSLTLQVGTIEVQAYFPGAGHTSDNIIGYVPSENAMFGGCLVKALGASKGYLGDADTLAWSATMIKLKAKYPRLRIVIPGHGQTSDAELLDYTEQLFHQENHP